MARYGIGGVIALGFAASAFGQCVPGWSDQFTPAAFDGWVSSPAPFDDGSSVRLAVLGEFTRDGGHVGELPAVWDGTSWQTLAGVTADRYGIFRADNRPGSRRLGLATLSGVSILEGGVWAALPDVPRIVFSPEDLEFGPADAPSDVYICGTFQVDAHSFSPVVRWDGQSWEALGVGSLGQRPRDIAWYDDGTGMALYCAADSDLGGVQIDGVGRWTGSAWEPVAPTGTPEIDRLVVYDDGQGPALFGIGRDTLTRWDGSQWASYGVESPAVWPDALMTSVELNGAAELVWASQTDNETFSLWRWDGVDGEQIGGDITGEVYGIEADTTGALGGGLIVTGDFLHVGGVDACNVARWDGTAWHAVGTESLGNGAPDASDVLALGPDVGEALGNRLYVAGARFAGGDSSRYLASWDGQAWDRFAPPDWVEFFGGAMTYGDLGDGARLFFATAARDMDQGYPVRGVASWDGSAWDMLPPAYFDSSPTKLVIGDVGGQRMLFAVGTFHRVYGVDANHVAGFDGTDWLTLGHGTDDWVDDAVIFDDGTGSALYVGGRFTTADDEAAPGIARWDGQVWHAVGDGLDAGDGIGVKSLAVVDLGDGARLFAGGDFESSGGTTLNGVAVWDGTAWQPLGDGFGLNGSVSSLGAIETPDGTRLAAGGIDGGVRQVRLWDGATWTTLEDDLNGAPLGIAQASYDQNAIYLVGEFSEVGGVPSEGIARYGCAPCPADFNGDGVVDTRDFIAFLGAWAAGDDSADFDGDGDLTAEDFLAYLSAWTAGC